MKLIFVQVVIFGIFVFNVSAENFKCYVCESGLDEKEAFSCELAHSRHIETCNFLIPTTDKACKTEWKRDKNNVLVWVKRSCSDVVNKALTIEKNCGEDGDLKDGKCFCKNDLCNDRSLMDPAWKDSNYRYPLSPIQIVFIVLTCIASVTLIGILIWWCVKIRKDKKNRAVAPENPADDDVSESDSNLESEVKIESDVESEPKLESDREMPIESDPKVESSDPEVTVEEEIVNPQPEP